jgi:hypothetical protein
MKTLWQPADKQELNTRLARLNNTSLPQWGKMSCGQMLAHLTDALQMALGELQIKPKAGPLRYWPLKPLILNWLPFPKGAPTAPELIARSPQEIQPELAELQKLMERFAASTARQDWPEHPAFGKLSAREWGALIYKHMDHHLRQFGV